MALINRITQNRLNYLGDFGMPHDRFLFNSRGDRCAVWSSLNAEGMIISLGNFPSIQPLDKCTGFASCFTNNDDMAICKLGNVIDEIQIYSPGGDLKSSIPLPANCKLSAEFPTVLTFDKTQERLAIGYGTKVYIFDISKSKLLDIKQLDENSLVIGIDEQLCLYQVNNYDREGATLSIKSYKSEVFFKTRIAQLSLPQLSINQDYVYYFIDKPYWRSEVFSCGKNQLYLPYSKTMVFCNNGSIVVQLIQNSGSFDEEIYSLMCWDLPQRKLIGVIQIDTPLFRMAGARSCKLLAIARVPTLFNPKGRIDIFSLDTFDLIFQVCTDALAIDTITISPFGNYVIVSTDGKYLNNGSFQEELPAQSYYSFLHNL
jgi:hypothetical protein